MSTKSFRHLILAMHKESRLQYYDNLNQIHTQIILWISPVYPTLLKSFTDPKTAQQSP